LTGWACGDVLSIAQGNAMTVSNVTAWYSNRGIVFDGAGSQITMINTEQVNNDLVILGADCCEFGPGYFEDARPDLGPTLAFLTSGVTGFYDVTHCIFNGIRIGGGAKKGIVLRGSWDLTFINVRTYSAPVEVSATSPWDAYGTLINCDFDIEKESWSKVNAESRFGAITTPTSPLKQRGMIVDDISPNFGTISPQATATVDVTLDAPISVAYSRYNAQIQVVSAVNELVVMSARILSPTVVRLLATNPSSAPVAHSFTGYLSLQLFGA
jgi:hypothetical protein